MKAIQRTLREEGYPVPLQLLCAAQDPAVLEAYGERFATLVPGAELVLLAEGSPLAHVDAPEAFCEAVLPSLPSRWGGLSR